MIAAFSRVSVLRRRIERTIYIYLFIRHGQIQSDWRRQSIRNENMMHKYYVFSCECISSCLESTDPNELVNHKLLILVIVHEILNWI